MSIHQARTTVCPVCHTRQRQVHDGTAPGGDSRTSPWIFVQHNRIDYRGEHPVRVICPASGRSRFEATVGW
ncbi:hypothetical protein ONR57_18105 [Hoyosella sp. YIM 151337]|uniref:hypothetical protein n=1 Tax=Hoyosella sp. YIM 151337 TaxID=2992742 RepID=UPI0022368F0F|nr:hypothetical protein [Hoyosella sp. YIM 151337]MCW4355221.1 hypothetical protein [Hoyosella sp. YIM 151337]